LLPAAALLLSALTQTRETPASPAAPLRAAPGEFSNPQRVLIRGYDGDVMEPFISRDGRHLFFNNRNDPPAQTRLFLATPAAGGDFQFAGPVTGSHAGDPALDAVASMDEESHFYFISTRSYPTTHQTVYTGNFANRRLRGVHLVPGDFSASGPGWVTMDAEISADGSWLYFANALLHEIPFHPET
jgi:hypothetical protein